MILNRWALAVVLAVVFCRICAPVDAAEASPPIIPLGDLGTLNGWTGLERVAGAGPQGTIAAKLAIPGQADFEYPAGSQGWHKRGFRVENDSTSDWRDDYGIQFDVQLDGDRTVQLDASIEIPPQPVRLDYVPRTSAKFRISGAGWHRVTLPWTAFDFPQAAPAFLKFVSRFRLAASFADGHEDSGTVLLANVRLVRGEPLILDSEVRGKSITAGQNVEYSVTVGNCTDERQSVVLSIQKHGWEAMDAAIEPAQFDLKPGQTRQCLLRVQVPSRVPAGGHETQVVQAIANGDASHAARLSFITASELPHPNIVHTIDGWDDIRQNVKQYAWARAGQADYVDQAEKWNVPDIAAPPDNQPRPDDQMGTFLFKSEQHDHLFAAAVAWQLTGEKEFAQKAALLLRRLSDPECGYPKTLRACNQALVQEGEFFQHSALAYDLILDAGVLSDQDRRQIENTFRLYIGTISLEADGGAINNWDISEITGALYCALAMQDLVCADRFLHGPSGILDQLAKGTMDDGWWYECSISYNVWCASEFSQIAIAMRPWGENLKDLWVPVGLAPNYAIVPWALQPGLYGMNFEKFGPVTHNSVNIKRLWDSLPVYIDYRGVIFGVNDANDARLDGRPYEIAYYLYRDPVYAGIIKHNPKRDLLYAVPDLPRETPDLSSQSAYADNVGLAMLRSQTPGRPQREQIQAVLHYGTLGGFHGHFDRTDFLSMMRYGRSFWGPEVVWYGYFPYMYKFYVQTSVSTNMVVVDQKMQEPVESSRLLFHTGQLMQAAVVQTNARWSNPPYGGMVYDWFKGNFADKTWAEGRSIPIPADAPQYGDIGPYTDRVLQRRAMIVADNYVVLADFDRGEQEHQFDALFQIKGFHGLHAAQMTHVRHTGQWNTDPLSSAQFVTDCDWYDVQAPARSHFEMSWGGGTAAEGDMGGRGKLSEPGMLKVDVHSLWPAQQQIMIGTAPEDHNGQKQLSYSIAGDGKIVAQGKTGAWVLGQVEIDVPVDGLRQLELRTSVAESKKPNVFWANARIVTRGGKEISLADLSPKMQNVLTPRQTGKDFFGAPIKIAGIEYPLAISGQPKDEKQSAVIKIDLSRSDAVRFKAVLGADYPMAPDLLQRKTYAIGAHGRQARFLTLIEPYEDQPIVRDAVALDADHIQVDLADGRRQIIELRNFEGDGRDIQISMTETRDGQTLRTESTDAVQ